MYQQHNQFVQLQVGIKIKKKQAQIIFCKVYMHMNKSITKKIILYEFLTFLLITLQMQIVINNDMCVKCMQCAQNCACGAINIQDGKLVIINDRCMKCLQCFCLCPRKAIQYGDITADDAEKVEKMFEENPTMDSITHRKSIRHFKQTPINKEIMNNLLQTVQYAPSARNTRNVEFYVLNRETLDKVAMDVAKTLHFEKAQEHFDLIFRGAPHCIVAVADKSKPIYQQDGVIFLETIELVAESMNIGTFWDGFFNGALHANPQLQKEVGIPEDKQIIACMGIGYKDIQFRRIALKEKL